MLEKSFCNKTTKFIFLRNGTVINSKMLSVPESQILIKSVPQFTRSMTLYMPSLSDQMNSMTRTNHLSKIPFAEIQIIITRIEFTFVTPSYTQWTFSDTWDLFAIQNTAQKLQNSCVSMFEVRGLIWRHRPLSTPLHDCLFIRTRWKVYTKNFDSGMNQAGNRILRSLGYKERRSFF